MVEKTDIAVDLLPVIQKLRTSGLSFGELEALAFLKANPGVSLREVEVNASITTSKQNVAKTLGNLEEKGLVTKRHKEWASNIRELYLTEDAESLLKGLEAVLVDSLRMSW